ncbi:exopolysaccharide biosynthesis polyprenyl glycosylphosphotransferase [Streptomyces piniterrae]|uniref:Exopolysaccharide biosynthesis polyprenyl glycosylphosphotransferase n=1 Tax=Streptomyces piniterrae TaxID=2571125 RepID=A0A4U0NZW9_9ACTN|nr:exopolysaccharide biosynthesis polyprenyl glycosylphosphotransferase [Streptomyces piniterrae]TJZ55944.1 exopolysaccharide biosynthesis polyprenyl glycosylphosphotransferase [Streptomyces piniterrae]
MTTESADAPHSARFLPRPAAAPTAAVAVYPPRRPGRDTPSPPGPSRARRHRTTGPLVAVDCLAATGAALLVHDLAQLPALLGPMVLCLLVLNRRAGLYRPGLAPTALGDLPALLGRAAVCWCAAAAALAACRPGRSLELAALVCAPAVHAVLACGGRAAVYRVRRGAARRRPRSALVIGVDPAARQLAAALHAHPEYGLRPVGLVVPAAVVPGASDGSPDAGPPLPRLSSAQDVIRAVIQNTVRDAVFTRPPEADPQTTALLRRFVGQGATIWLAGAAAGYGGRPAGPGGEHLWGFACRRLDTAPPRHGGRGKRAVDVVVAAFALLAATPVLLGCALAVRLSDGPGVIFRQERIGRHGRTFMLLKFRTLRPRDEHESATRWSVADDRRMSPVGRLLRRTSLDELPQLWNVLRGDMSLVGPRPERPYFVEQFTQSYPDYDARHRMPAGITGLAQVHGLRGDTSIEDRARFDNLYIDGWSLWQDALIMLRTAASLFRMEGR